MDPAVGVNRQEETSTIRFHSEQITAHFLSPDGSEVIKSLEVRFDPLLGTSSRIAEGVVLSKAEDSALAPLQASNRAGRRRPARTFHRSLSWDPCLSGFLQWANLRKPEPRRTRLRPGAFVILRALGGLGFVACILGTS